MQAHAKIGPQAATHLPGPDLRAADVLVASSGCVILQPYDMEVGRRHLSHRDLSARDRTRALARRVRAALAPARPTAATATTRSACSTTISFRCDQALAARRFQELYLEALRALGFDPLVHDVRFVEDNWESPTLGAWGLGWEVWLNGMEISQFTYFQQVGGLDCRPVMGEITYGLERLACTSRARRASSTSSGPKARGHA